jgi:tetratricopeptide (TPR) repeat protein
MNSQHGVFVSLKEQVPASSAVSQRPTISAHELAMPEKARDLMNSGIHKLYKEKNPQGALSDFQSAAAKAPAFYEAYYQAGMAYLTLQNEAEAEKQFRTSVDVSKNMYGDADIALATLLLRRQPEDESEALLRQGLALNPQSWPGQVELGKLELSRGHMETALGAAKKAESLAPQQPIVYRLLSAIHLKQKDYSALLTDLDTYIRLDSDSPAGQRAQEMRAQLARQLTQSQTAAASATVK